MSFSRRMALLLSCFAAFLLPVESFAVGLIRDAEIEDTLRAYANPIFDSAGIPPQDVRILIVSDPSINAYVAGGLNLFLHTGLILATKKPGELIGVIAHETGHIAGAHLSQLNEKSNRATLGAVISALLGAAAVVGGSPGAGGGILMGGMSMSQRGYLSGIRLNEASADQAGAALPRRQRHLGHRHAQHVRDAEAQGRPGLPGPVPHRPPADHRAHRRHARPRQRIEHPARPGARGLRRAPRAHDRQAAGLHRAVRNDHEHLPGERYFGSVAARYARAIAAYRHHDLAGALAGMDALIKEHPRDAFFYDTKGQILFENAKLPEAEAAYGRASSLMPDSALIMTDYAAVLVAAQDRSKLPQAIAMLERSKEMDDSYSTTWRELGMAYGLEGKLGLSYEALAEEAALAGDYKRVLQHVARARQYMSDDPSLGLLLDDLERDAKAQLHHKDEHKLFLGD
ncbi:MAG: M48 family metalloprotease [Alphaproteobacteria bacterium]